MRKGFERMIMAASDLKDLSVAVLTGGWSDEREISISSGESCAAALKEAGFTKVDMLDIAEEGFVGKLTAGGYDVAFVALHGPYGEDGCIQGLLEILHMPYTFSGVLASAVGTEKEVAKGVYRAAGIPTPEGIVLDKYAVPSEEGLDDIVAELGLPLFVKPAANGSSYGVTKVTGRDQLKDAIIAAHTGDTRVLIEQCIDGIEITVPVIGNSDPEALPIIEINTGAEFYDLKVKYEPSELHHVIPARMSEETYKQASKYAVAAHKALGCKGCSRSDFIVTADGVPVILETNTIPGMTSTSLLPDSARHAGISFPELCTRFIELALEESA